MKVPYSRDELQAAIRRREKTPSPCQSEEGMLAFYSGGLSEAEEARVREHLAACPSCLDLAGDARRFLEAMGPGGGEHGAEATGGASEPRAWPKPLALAAGAALLAVGLWTATRGHAPRLSLDRSSHPPSPPSTQATPPAPSWSRELPIPKAPYAPPSAPDDGLVFRDQGGAPPGTGSFENAMAPYLRGDFSLAERLLGDRLAHYPGDDRARFYRAVSLLLLDRAIDAVPLLEPLARGGSPLRDEARFYIALAYLKLGRPEKARPELEALVDASDGRRADALALVQRLGVRRSPR